MALKKWIVFRNNAVRTLEVIYTENPNPVSAPDKAFEFVPVGGDDNAENYTHNGSALQYAPPAPAPTQPNHVKFSNDVLSDNSLTVAIRERVALMILFYMMGQKSTALLIWNGLSGNVAAPTIRTHATNNNLTLP